MGSSFDLQDRELEVDLNIYADRTINVALPYVQDRGRDMMEFVMGCLEKLNKNDVYCAYDSELDRLVKRSDLSAMLERYRDLPEITAQRKARREAAKAAKKKEEKKPWWKVW